MQIVSRVGDPAWRRGYCLLRESRKRGRPLANIVHGRPESTYIATCIGVVRLARIRSCWRPMPVSPPYPRSRCLEYLRYQAYRSVLCTCENKYCAVLSEFANPNIEETIMLCEITIRVSQPVSNEAGRMMEACAIAGRHQARKFQDSRGSAPESDAAAAAAAPATKEDHRVIQGPRQARLLVHCMLANDGPFQAAGSGRSGFQ